jgi:hypothetical protein
MLIVSRLLSVVDTEQLTINEGLRAGFLKLDTDPPASPVRLACLAGGRALLAWRAGKHRYTQIKKLFL